MTSNRVIRRIMAAGIPNRVYRVSNTSKMVNYSRVLPGCVYCIRVKWSARQARQARKGY